MTIKAPSTAALGELRIVALASASGRAFSTFRFYTVRVWPALIRLRAMREPIAPRPRKAIIAKVISSRFL